MENERIKDADAFVICAHWLCFQCGLFIRCKRKKLKELNLGRLCKTHIHMSDFKSRLETERDELKKEANEAKCVQ